jgi:hypothetical protein
MLLINGSSFGMSIIPLVVGISTTTICSSGTDKFV